MQKLGVKSHLSAHFPHPSLHSLTVASLFRNSSRTLLSPFLTFLSSPHTSFTSSHTFYHDPPPLHRTHLSSHRSHRSSPLFPRPQTTGQDKTGKDGEGREEGRTEGERGNRGKGERGGRNFPIYSIYLCILSYTFIYLQIPPNILK